VRALLVQALTRTEFRLQSIASTNTDTNGHVEVRAELVGDQRDDRQMESAVSRLSLVSRQRAASEAWLGSWRYFRIGLTRSPMPISPC